jgi:putative ABC transport system permease protein
VRAAAGVAPVSVEVTDPDLDQDYGEAVTAGPLGQLLDLGVTSGSAAAPRPGQIEVSALEAGSSALNVRTGSAITVYLPDGTPYHATVSAIYSRSLASGDLVIPASIAAGHTGTPPGYSQILVDGGTQAELARFTAGHPGLRVTSRSVANQQSAQAAAQNSFANNLILGVLGALSAVALVNTLVVTTVERRRVLRLLGRVGATRGQIAAMFGWQALFVAATGLVAGAAAGAVTLLTVTRAITGSLTPFIPPAAGVGLVAVVVALTVGAVMIPLGVMSRRPVAAG